MMAIPPTVIMHTPALPCSKCTMPTTTSRIEGRPNGRWRLIPLCPIHLTEQSDGSTTS
jgi:hypothetical protein